MAWMIGISIAATQAIEIVDILRYFASRLDD